MNSPRLAAGKLQPVGLIAVLALVGWVRWRFLNTALERDEGEFAYGAQRILAGNLPYVSFHAMKLPGIYWAYAAALSLFGETARGVHLGLLVVNLASIVLVYAIGTKLFESGAGLASAAAFGLLTLAPTVQGTQAQAEHFVILWLLAGALLLVYQRWIFVAGLCFGMALVTKQHGAVFGLAALLSCGRRWPLLLAGWMAPLAVTSVVMASLGAWDQFVFWTWSYPREYATQVPIGYAPQMFRITAPQVFLWCAPLWILGAAGIIVRWRRLALPAMASVAAILPGWLFQSHYFLFLIPVVSLGVGGIASWLRGLPALGAVAWCAISLGVFYARHTPSSLMVEMYQDSFFNESPDIAKFLVENTQPGDAIGVLASEPQICFYAGRPSASPHIYMYPLVENHQYAQQMQEELAADIERAAPKYLVYSGDDSTWLYHQGAPRHVYLWAQQYLTDHYYFVGRVECFQGKPSKLAWTAEALEIPPETDRWIGIYRRKAGH